MKLMSNEKVGKIIKLKKKSNVNTAVYELTFYYATLYSCHNIIRKGNFNLRTGYLLLIYAQNYKRSFFYHHSAGAA